MQAVTTIGLDIDVTSRGNDPFDFTGNHLQRLSVFGLIARSGVDCGCAFCDVRVSEDDTQYMRRNTEVAEDRSHRPSQIVPVPSGRAGESMQPLGLSIPITQHSASL